MKQEIKVGDCVKIKTWGEMMSEYGLDSDGDINCGIEDEDGWEGKPFFSIRMKYLCGEILPVTEIRSTNYFNLGDEGWYFSPDMISEIIPDEVTP